MPGNRRRAPDDFSSCVTSKLLRIPELAIILISAERISARECTLLDFLLRKAETVTLGSGKQPEFTDLTGERAVGPRISVEGIIVKIRLTWVQRYDAPSLCDEASPDCLLKTISIGESRR